MITPISIDENTPKDRPIIVFAYSGDTESWPHCVQCCVAQWYETVMRAYCKKWRRPGDEDPETVDLSQFRYWSMLDVPQGSIDSSLAFEPTHWCEIPKDLP